jgi:hypothetical protein
MTEQAKLETDEVEASRAPLLDHLNELRSRLIKSVLGVVAGMIVCVPFLSFIIDALLWPFEQAILRYNSRMLTAGKPPIDMEIIATQPLETFFVKLKIALFGGIILGFPVVASTRTNAAHSCPIWCSAPCCSLRGQAWSSSSFSRSSWNLRWASRRSAAIRRSSCCRASRII